MNAGTDARALDAVAAVLRDGPSDAKSLDAIRVAIAGTGRDVPSVRRFLDLSTAHLPQHLIEELGSVPGVVADPTPFGAWLWVPDDPDESAQAGAPPDEVLAIWRYARALGCDWVLLDGDSVIVDALPTFDDPP